MFPKPKNRLRRTTKARDIVERRDDLILVKYKEHYKLDLGVVKEINKEGAVCLRKEKDG